MPQLGIRKVRNEGITYSLYGLKITIGWPLDWQLTHQWECPWCQLPGKMILNPSQLECGKDITWKTHTRHRIWVKTLNCAPVFSGEYVSKLFITFIFNIFPLFTPSLFLLVLLFPWVISWLSWNLKEIPDTPLLVHDNVVIIKKNSPVGSPSYFACTASSNARLYSILSYKVHKNKFCV